MSMRSEATATRPALNPRVIHAATVVAAPCLPALAYACPATSTEAMLLIYPAAIGMSLIMLSGVGFALYDMVMAILKRSLSRRMALLQSAVMSGHVALSFWGTLWSSGSDQVMLFGYLVFSCLILIHAIGELTASQES